MTQEITLRPRRKPLRLIEGNGWPSTSKQLERTPPRPPNTNDPNGFYEMLGVPPWATLEEIKRAYRSLAKVFHPDGSEPDPDAFRLLQDIYETLSDPVKREMYNNCPGDSVYISESMKHMVFDGEQVIETYDMPLPPQYQPPKYKYWSFYTGIDNLSIDLVMDWYELLLETAHTDGIESDLRLGFMDSWAYRERDPLSAPYMLRTLEAFPVLLIDPYLKLTQQWADMLIWYWRTPLLRRQETLYTGRDNGSTPVSYQGVS